MPAFTRFLRVAALCNAPIVNLSKVASDAQVPRITVYEYFEILKDTRIIHEVPAWRSSAKRKPLASSKYSSSTSESHPPFRAPATSRTAKFDVAFESCIFHELLANRDRRPRHALAAAKNLRRYLCVCAEARRGRWGIQVVPYAQLPRKS